MLFLYLLNAGDAGVKLKNKKIPMEKLPLNKEKSSLIIQH